MIVPIDDSFLKICRAIVEESRSEEEWAEIESDDMFQEGRFVGGFDADEGEFCFSFFGDSELWFQVSLEKVERLAEGEQLRITMRPAD